MAVRLFAVIYLFLCASLVGCNPGSEKVSLSQAKEIAKEAYIFAYPMMRHYNTMYQSAIVGRAGVAPRKFNQFFHRRQLLGPDFKLIVGPNNDTLYSSVWLDLRAGPLVISVPAVSEDRYYSFQLIDMYVNNFAYIGQRTTGSGAGDYVIVGPGQDVGDLDETHHVIRSESAFAFIIGRILAGGKEDLPNVHEIQDKLRVTPLNDFLGLNEFLGEGTSGVFSDLEFLAYDDVKARSFEFIDYINFFLKFAEIHPSDKELFEKFKLIGIGVQPEAGTNALTAEMRTAVNAGVKAAHAEIVASKGTFGREVNGWNQTSRGFGSRETRRGNLLARASAAMTALYGNSREENNSFISFTDSQGAKLDGSKENYTIRFLPGQTPPVEGFWSMTMYRIPEMLLVANPMGRYSIGDRSRGLVHEKDGSLILYLQHLPPAPDKRPNWLPAPNGPFGVALRLYRPSEAILKGEWTPPYLKRNE